MAIYCADFIIKGDFMTTIFYPTNRTRTLTDNDAEKIRNAINFLSKFDPLSVSDIELEYIVMHTAFLVSDHNAFVNNYNIEPARRERFLDHMTQILTSDINTWCKQLYEFGFWRHENFATVNLIWNWLNGTLSDPKSLL